MEQQKKNPKSQNSNKKPINSKNKPENLLINTQKNSEQFFRIGNYIIEGTVGCGTFGKVKLGIHLPDKERVAIKIIDKKKMTEKDDHIRLEREFKILEKFNHPNLITVTEIFESENHYYTVMELCEEGELFNYIVKKNFLSENESSFFYYQLINGLEYIHSLGIVHRDLKPENLLLTKEHILKIIDFGLSNFFKENQNELLYTPCGSPCYSSPEMVSGKNYNGILIDIWSSGVILFAMLCGYLPFEDKNNEILFKKIVNCKVDYPDYLSFMSVDLLKKILVPDPNKRITIPEIKKHPFYLKGKKIFDQEFTIEIIKQKNQKNENCEESNINNQEINNNNYNFNTEKTKKKKSMINNKINKTKNEINDKNIINNDELARLGQLNLASITTSSDGAYISTIEDINNLKNNNDENIIENKIYTVKKNNKNEEEKNSKKEKLKIIEIVNNSGNDSISNRNLESNSLSNKPIKKRKKKEIMNMKNNFEKSENKQNEKQNNFIETINEDQLKSINQDEIKSRNTYIVQNNLNQIDGIKKIKNNNLKIKKRKTEISRIQHRKNSPLLHQINTTDLYSLNSVNGLKVNDSIEKTKGDINKNYHKLDTKIINKKEKPININPVKKSPGQQLYSTIYNTNNNNNKIRKNCNLKKTYINKNIIKINKLNDNNLYKKSNDKNNDKTNNPTKEITFDITNVNNISGAETFVKESEINYKFPNKIKYNEKSNLKEKTLNSKSITKNNLRQHIININERKTVRISNYNTISSKIFNSKNKNDNENKQNNQNKLTRKTFNNNTSNINKFKRNINKINNKISNRINSNSSKKDYSHSLYTNYIFNKNTNSLNNYEINTIDLESITGHINVFRPKNSSLSNNKNNNIQNSNYTSNMDQSKNNSKKKFIKKNIIISKYQQRNTKLKSNSPLRNLKNVNMTNKTICNDISNNNVKIQQIDNVKNNVIDLNEKESRLLKNNCLLSQSGKKNSNSIINDVKKKNKGHTSANSENLINNMNVINSSINAEKKIENTNKNQEKKYVIDNLFSNKNAFFYNNTEFNENKNISRFKHKKIKSNGRNLRQKINEKESYKKRYKTTRKKIPCLFKDGNLFKFRSKSNEKLTYDNNYDEKKNVGINKIMITGKENLKLEKICKRVTSYEMMRKLERMKLIK